MGNKKMYPSTILYWSFLYATILTCTRADQVDKNLSPINIITSTVTNLGVKPLTLALKPIDLFVPVKVTNTGTAIIFVSSSYITRSPIDTGPALNNEKYYLTYRLLYINQSLGRSGHEINGQGYPIEGVNIFTNVKYPNFEVAKQQKDGLAVLYQPVHVKGKNNTEFEAFEKLLLSGALRKPFSSAVTTTSASFTWYDSALKGRAFYKYEGSLYDPQTKKQIATAGSVVTQPIFYNSISLLQFEAFKNILDFKGKPLNVVAPIYPQGSRTIDGTLGVNLEILPYGITIPLLT